MTETVASHQEIAALFTDWNLAIGTQDPQKVVALYATDAVLLPTLSNRVRHNHEEIKDYFVSFLSRKASATIVESNIRIIGDIALNSGVYSFEFIDPADNKRSFANARYTFVYRRMADRWLIIEHHSSLMPEA